VNEHPEEDRLYGTIIGDPLTFMPYSQLSTLLRERTEYSGAELVLMRFLGSRGERDIHIPDDIDALKKLTEIYSVWKKDDLYNAAIKKEVELRKTIRTRQ
jgi:hypothetical protein